MSTYFHSLHKSGEPLVLINAWDAASAAVAADAGSRAVATTSAGVAWSLGRPDGNALGREAAVALVTRVVSIVDVPVTADIESGFGDTPDEVAQTVREIVAAGAVGVNIEDSGFSIDEQAKRYAAARAVGVDLFINARIDTYLGGSADLDETIARAKAYLESGVDGIFVPGVVDPVLIGKLVSAIPAPLNVLVGHGAPSVSELAGLGVARVSLGSSVAQAAYGLVKRATEEALSKGTYTAVAEPLDYSALNALMRQ